MNQLFVLCIFSFIFTESMSYALCNRYSKTGLQKHGVPCNIILSLINHLFQLQYRLKLVILRFADSQTERLKK